MQLISTEQLTITEERYRYKIEDALKYCNLIDNNFIVEECLVLTKDNELFERSEWVASPDKYDNIEAQSYRCSYQGEIIKFVVDFKNKVLCIMCKSYLIDDIEDKL